MERVAGEDDVVLRARFIAFEAYVFAIFRDAGVALVTGDIKLIGGVVISIQDVDIGRASDGRGPCNEAPVARDVGTDILS